MADIIISSSLQLRSTRTALEEALDEFFAGRAAVTGSGGGWRGWNVDVSVPDESLLPKLVISLATFLQQWPAPPDTCLEIYRDGEQDGTLYRIFPPAELEDAVIRHLYALYRSAGTIAGWAEARRRVEAGLDEIERHKGVRPYPEREPPVAR